MPPTLPLALKASIIFFCDQASLYYTNFNQRTASIQSKKNLHKIVEYFRYLEKFCMRVCVDIALENTGSPFRIIECRDNIMTASKQLATKNKKFS